MCVPKTYGGCQRELRENGSQLAICVCDTCGYIVLDHRFLQNGLDVGYPEGRNKHSVGARCQVTAVSLEAVENMMQCNMQASFLEFVFRYENKTSCAASHTGTRDENLQKNSCNRTT